MPTGHSLTAGHPNTTHRPLPTRTAPADYQPTPRTRYRPPAWDRPPTPAPPSPEPTRTTTRRPPPTPHPPTQSTADLTAALTATYAHTSLENTARRHGVRRDTARALLIAAGVTIRPRGLKTPVPTPDPRAEDWATAYRAGTTLKAIATTAGVSRETVARILRRDTTVTVAAPGGRPRTNPE